MAAFGKKGYAGLVKKLGGEEEVSKHHTALAERRWRLHPEQRAK